MSRQIRDDSYETTPFIYYLNDYMARITCPRCGHDYQLTRRNVSRRMQLDRDEALLCLDCRWTVRSEKAI